MLQSNTLLSLLLSLSWLARTYAFGVIRNGGALRQFETLSFAWNGVVTKAVHRPTPLYASNSDNGDGNNNDAVNNMRQFLESAWNKESMGEVPSSPESAAAAAAVAIRNAQQNRNNNNNNNASSKTLMVDILLPQYDASQGDKVYDQVLAVEFCIALANQLETKSSIVVRDNQTIQTVRRILDKREEMVAKLEAQQVEVRDDQEEQVEDTGNDANNEDDDKNESIEDADTTSDMVDASQSEIDSFRAKLSAEWNKDDDSRPIEKPIEPKESKPTSTPRPKFTPTKKLYRLCGMLGDAIGMRAGPDMQRSVVEAVKENALPNDDEETMIILSAASPQELVGIRALVGKYQSTKNVILVNCMVKPLPRELVGAQTVYSILPLVAKPTSNPSSNTNASASPPARVVVMRRFPRDWEVFVDDSGAGFELAATAPVSSAGQKGPTLEWVINAVQRYLKARTR